MRGNKRGQFRGARFNCSYVSKQDEKGRLTGKYGT